MITYEVKRYYKSIYHDPVFDGVLKDTNLSADQTGDYTIMEFNNAQVSVSGTFGSSPFSQSSNLRLTTATTNPAAGSSFSNPMFWGEFPASFMKSIANNNKAYVLFAIPMGSGDNMVYMVGYYDNITWAGGTNQVIYNFKVSFIKNGYDPNTASGADKLFTSTWEQRTCGVVFSSSKILFGVSRILAKNDNNQFIPASVQELVNFPLDSSVLVFVSMNVDNQSNPETLPTLGSMIKYQIASNNRALQAATQPGAGIGQTNAGLMFVAPAYVEANYNCKIAYESKLVSEEVGEISEPGGYEGGTFEYESDQISISQKPSIGMSTSGLYHIYQVYQGQLSGIGAEILGAPQGYTPKHNTGNDTVSVLQQLSDDLYSIIGSQAADQILKIGEEKLIDYVVDLHMIPVFPTTSGTDNIHIGWKTLETVGSVVTDDYVDVDCGRVQTKEFYANFADYITNIKLFLPFVGFVPVQPEWFQNATVGVQYRFNVIDGSFMCWVTGYGEHINRGSDHGYHSGLLAQYSGSACIHMPITGPNYAAMMSGQIGAVAGVLSNAAFGNISGAAGSAISGMLMKPDVAQSNAYSASSAILSHRTPFFMISRPTSHYSQDYQHELGLPANITSKLGDLSGFVQMTDVHLDGIRGTAREKEIIRSKLAEGVIV